MSRSRRRRIVRRAVMTLAVVVLLPVWYVGAWLALPCFVYHGPLTWDEVGSLEDTVFAPISLYLGAEAPGSDSILALRRAVNHRLPRY